MKYNHSSFYGLYLVVLKTIILKGNCKPKNDTGKLCDLVTGPGQILLLDKQWMSIFSGNPILEQYILEEGGNVIDDNGRG